MFEFDVRPTFLFFVYENRHGTFVVLSLKFNCPDVNGEYDSEYFNFERFGFNQKRVVMYRINKCLSRML